MDSRAIKMVTRGIATEDGAGVKLRRVFANSDVPGFDPYLLFDFFDTDNPDDYAAGFPWHPHRGIETITFLLEGEIEHGDSLGNKGVIAAGDCQWMNAGSGIIHQEMPQKSPRMLGAQLWANLPAAEKMLDPSYNEIKAGDIPLVQDENAAVRVIGGSYRGTAGPAQRADIEARLLDINVEPDGKFSIETDPDHCLFLVLFRGQIRFDDQEKIYQQPGLAILFERGADITATVSLSTGSAGARFILVSGRPIEEPVAWGGPIVMNTNEELEQAFQEIRAGTFICKKE